MTFFFGHHTSLFHSILQFMSIGTTTERTMAPREESSLLSSKHFDIRQSSFGAEVDNAARCRKKLGCAALFTTAAALMVGLAVVSKHHRNAQIQATGPYELVECQEGQVRLLRCHHVLRQK